MLRTGSTPCLAVLDVLESGSANTSTRPQVMLVTSAPSSSLPAAASGLSNVSMTVTAISSEGFSAAVSEKTKT
jgi:hypothetical protein